MKLRAEDVLANGTSRHKLQIDMERQIQIAKDLLAQKKFLEAAKRCQQTLDSLPKDGLLPDPELFTIFAQAVYNMEVQNSGNLFGDALLAGDDGSGSEPESEPESDVSNGEEGNENGQTEIPNSRMFQFDQEEEDLTGDVDSGDSEDSGEGSEEEEENVEKEEERLALHELANFSPANEYDDEIEDVSQLRKSGFHIYFENDLYENALDLLAQALMLLGRPTADGQSLTENSRLRIGDVYILMGDIEREAEMFSRAIHHYLKALGYYKTLKPAEQVTEKVIQAEFLVCDALRWVDQVPAKDKLKRFKHAKALLEKHMTTRPKDSELQQARLAQIQDDIDEVQENQQHGSKRPLSQPTTSIGFPALEKPLGDFNDLSQLVKKKPRRH
ncbi:AIC_G0034810.mRNA.1.CDS.1 [Saccharomyces cerevisiae]|nr:AIC_G0034810.mRNA.1.CDS.1 [Saccharomyces cerevisiae]CAI6788371.1 AIC_G0034810.mRNA.1.CDS.1 [Saccharomyces cerevisiae]